MLLFLLDSLKGNISKGVKSEPCDGFKWPRKAKKQIFLQEQYAGASLK